MPEDKKLYGPGARMEIKCMNYLILPFVFFDWAAIIFLTLLYHIKYASIITRAAICTDITRNHVSHQVMLYFFSFFSIIFHLPLVQFVYWWIWRIFCVIFCTVYVTLIIFFSSFSQRLQCWAVACWEANIV